MNTLQEAVGKLSEQDVPFSVHYPTTDSWVITVKGSLTNAQLAAVVALGAGVGPDGFMILGYYNA